MTQSGRRLLILFAALPVVLVSVALAYQTGMHYLEGNDRNFWQALEWASETLTTTGYGADARWTHPVMILFVICLQFIGVFLVYMLVPLILLPLLESRFEKKLPRVAPSSLEDHVLIFRFGPAVETLVDELLAAQVPWLVVERDEDLARDLLEQWQSGGSRYRAAKLIHVSSVRLGLERARLGSARALIANGSDEENASIVMNARELGFEGEILALVEEPHHRHPLEVAGASGTFTPRLELGNALAARVSQHLAPRIAGDHLLAPHLEVSEMRIDPGSPLAGLSLREAQLTGRLGATVLGQWTGGDLDTHPTPETVILEKSTLLAIGEPSSIAELHVLAGAEARRGAEGRLLLVGHGEVGQRVAELLRDVDESLWVVDKRPGLDGVDFCGDIADPKVLHDLELEKARAVILALDNDSATFFAMLILRQHAPDLPVIARVNHAHNLERLYRAGADFAVSIAQVSAQSLVYHLLGRDILALEGQLEILRTSGEKMAGRRLSSLEIREKTGCSIAAIVRDEKATTALAGDFTVESTDAVFVCGSRAGIEKFSRLYGESS